MYFVLLKNEGNGEVCYNSIKKGRKIVHVVEFETLLSGVNVYCTTHCFGVYNFFPPPNT